MYMIASLYHTGCKYAMRIYSTQLDLSILPAYNKSIRVKEVFYLEQSENILDGGGDLESHAAFRPAGLSW